MVGVLTFTALFVDMAIDGWAPQLHLHVSRRGAQQAGILRPGWDPLVMLVTAVVAVPLRGRGAHLEEYAQELGDRRH
jgi:hypothetical protein